MTFEQRLDNLERSNRNLRAVVMFLVAATTLFTIAARPSAQKVLEAEKIVLRDQNGNERGQLFANEKSWGLVLFTERKAGTRLGCVDNSERADYFRPDRIWSSNFYV